LNFITKKNEDKKDKKTPADNGFTQAGQSGFQHTVW